MRQALKVNYMCQKARLTLGEVELDSAVAGRVTPSALVHLIHLALDLFGRGARIDLALLNGSDSLICTDESNLILVRVLHLNRLILQVVIGNEGLVVRDRLLGVLGLDQAVLHGAL